MNLSKKGYVRVAQIPISKNHNGLAEMDFVNYGDEATFLHLQGACPKYYTISFTGDKKKKDQTADKAARAVLANWISLFGTPGTILAAKASRFIGSWFSRFRNGRNITLHTVIPGRRQSSGGTVGGSRYFKDIAIQIDKSNNRQDRAVGWQEYASLGTIRINPPSPPIRRFYSMTESFRANATKNADWRGWKSEFLIFTNRNGSPVARRNKVLAIFRGIRKASLEGAPQ